MQFVFVPRQYSLVRIGTFLTASRCFDFRDADFGPLRPGIQLESEAIGRGVKNERLSRVRL